jgi:hypothetical protein
LALKRGFYTLFIKGDQVVFNRIYHQFNRQQHDNRVAFR